MLESTFIFLNGIGEATEYRLWEQGIHTWQRFLTHSSVPGIPTSRKALHDEVLKETIHHLNVSNARFFGRLLKTRDHWRLFETFRSTIAFLDIETTGEPIQTGEITVVGLYANGIMTSLIQGDSLTEERLNQELSQYDLLVTFFGSVFDIPYLRQKFPGLILDHAHFDLCFAARRLGFKGGLKHIELQLDLPRPNAIHGLDGWDAVRLWEAWSSGDSQAGELLLQYNEADARNLEPLAQIIYDQLVEHYWPKGIPRRLAQESTS